MELRHLQYLLTVAEEGSFTRAARKLFVSQPALSQQIRQLEEELGSTLLDRVGRGVRLTAAGEIFIQHARRVFTELDEARVALQELEGLERGSLAVGVVQTINSYLIPPVVGQFSSTYPAVSLLVEELTSDEIESGLEAGQLQVGVSFVPPGNDRLDWEALFEEELVLVVAKTHPIAARSEIRVADLNGFPLMMLSKSYATRRLWDAATQQAGIQPRLVAEMNNIGAILRAIEPTPAGTILPRLALAYGQTQNLVAVNLREPTPTRTVGLLWRRNSYQRAATRVFSNLIREISKSKPNHSS